MVLYHMPDTSHLYKLYALFEQVSAYLKYIFCELHYIKDSFSVAVCDNILIASTRLVSGKRWCGYAGSIRNYFYGVKVQLITAKEDILVAFHFTPGKTADAKALSKVLDKLLPESGLFADRAYMDYQIEDVAFDDKGILRIQQKSNAKRSDGLQVKAQKR